MGPRDTRPLYHNPAYAGSNLRRSRATYSVTASITKEALAKATLSPEQSGADPSVESGETPLIPVDLTQFKDVRGCYRTVSLFLELSRDDKYKTFFTLKDRDYKGHTSLRRAYLEENDPEEYTFALKYFGHWDHWLKLANNYWFKPLLREWRKELQIKMRSEQLQNLQRLAKQSGASGLSATRVLLKETAPVTRGRPSKEEVAGKLRQVADAEQDTEQDALRLGIVVPINRAETNNG